MKRSRLLPALLGVQASLPGARSQGQSLAAGVLRGLPLARNTPANVLILDVRNPDEANAGMIKGAMLIPDEETAARMAEIPKDRRIVTLCLLGIRAELTEGGRLRRRLPECRHRCIQGWQLQDHAALSDPNATRKACRLPRESAERVGALQQPPFFSFFGAGAEAALPAGAEAAAGADAPGFAGSAFLSSAAKVEAPASARHAVMIETFSLVIERLHQEVKRRLLQAAGRHGRARCSTRAAGCRLIQISGRPKRGRDRRASA
jgi:hypothetical protein